MEYTQRIIDTRKATILFIQEKMNRAFDTLKDFADKIKPYIEEMQELQEFEYEERPKYPLSVRLARNTDRISITRLYITDAGIGVENV